MSNLTAKPTPPVSLRLSPPISDETLNALFSASWQGHAPRQFQPILQRSLVYVCAFGGDRLIGFVNLAWDGGAHAFLLDTTVHPDYRRQGIGSDLVRAALDAAREGGIEWVHVDYEPHLEGFYSRSGFRPTLAGLVRLLS